MIVVGLRLRERGVGWVFSDEKLVSNCDPRDITVEVLYKITDLAFDVSNLLPTILLILKTIGNRKGDCA